VSGFDRADLCRIYECNLPRYQRGYCMMHYRRVWLYGGPGPVGRRGRAAPLADRFVNSVQQNGPTVDSELGPCWQWTGCVHRSGFGIIGHEGKKKLVHRVAWELVHGPLPSRVLIEQVCGNRLCVRLDHFRLRRSGERPAPVE
jgi:hypothetical protein